LPATGATDALEPVDAQAVEAAGYGAGSAAGPKHEEPPAETVRSDTDNPSEHGASGLAGALAGLLALKSAEVRSLRGAQSTTCSGFLQLHTCS
jgi:hypothetical protein